MDDDFKQKLDGFLTVIDDLDEEFETEDWCRCEKPNG